MPLPKLNNEFIMLAFVALTGVAMMAQAIILLAIFLSVRKMARSLHDQVEDVRSSIMPIIYNTRDLMTRLTPKLEAGVNDLGVLLHSLRQQSAKLEASTTEIVERVRVQSSRVDSMVTTALNAVDKAGSFVSQAVSKPIRQLSALMVSLKAIIESLRTIPEPRSTRPAGDKDMFV
jgi:uncharacterized protein YoxC